MGRKTGEREGQIEELVGNQNTGPETSLRSKKERERGAKEMLGEEQWIEVRRDDSVEYFLPTGCREYLLSPRGLMAVEVPQNRDFRRRK